MPAAGSPSGGSSGRFRGQASSPARSLSSCPRLVPAILGGNKKGLMGSYIVDQFMDARNGPLGASLSVVVLAVMLIGTLVYFRQGGRNL